MSYSYLRIPLLTLLGHPKGRQSIKAFALAEHSEETISFIDDVEGLRQLYPLWNAEKESKAEQKQPTAIVAAAKPPSSPSLIPVSPDRGEDSRSQQPTLSLSLEEDDTVAAQLPTSPRSAYSPSQRSTSHSSILSPLHRYSVFSCRSSVSSQENVVALRDFTFHIADNPTAHPLPPPLTGSQSPATRLAARPSYLQRASLLNTRGEALSVTSVVNEAATKIWQKYQPGAQFAISWHPLHLREVQAEIRRGGGRIDFPLVFNGQEEKEIENVQAGTLARYYASREYARLVDDLLVELATSVYNALGAQPTTEKQAAGSASSAVPPGVNEQKEKERVLRERGTSRDREAAGNKSSVVNVANLLRFDSGLSSVSSDSAASSPSNPASPVAGPIDSPTTATSSPLNTHHILSRGLSLRSMQRTDVADSSEESDGDDDKDGSGPSIRVSRTIQFLIPGRGARSSKENTSSHTHSSHSITDHHSNSGGSSYRSSTSHSPENQQPLPSRPSTAAPTLRSGSFRRQPPPILRPSSLASSADIQPLSPVSPSQSGNTRSLARRNGLMESRDGTGLVFPDTELLSTYGFFIFHFNPLGSQLIRHFMTAEWSVDNYDFLLAVDLFSTRAMSDRERRKEAKSIYQMFLSPESKREVTFPSDMRNDLVRVLQAADSDNGTNCCGGGGGGMLPVELFDGVLEVVLHTVRTDVFRRFLRSSTFVELNVVMRARYEKLKTASTSTAASAIRLPPLQSGVSAPAISRQSSRSVVDSGASPPLQTERARRSLTVTSDSSSNNTTARTAIKHNKHAKHAALTFTDVLNEPRLLRSYTQFCKREHSEENVLFYQDVSKYHSLHHSKANIDDIDSTAQAIYARYIAVDASFELPLNTAIRSAIQKELNFLHPSMFDEAMAVAVHTMREDSGKRFLKSEELLKWHTKHVTTGSGGGSGGSGSSSSSEVDHSGKRAHRAARSGSMSQR